MTAIRRSSTATGTGSCSSPMFVPARATAPAALAPDACHVASMCDPSTGACGMMVWPADGTSCSDGNSCNGAETCQAGVCTRVPRQRVPAAGSARSGICDPLNGCQTAPAADGTSCALENATGTCIVGVCGFAQAERLGLRRQRRQRLRTRPHRSPNCGACASPAPARATRRSSSPRTGSPAPVPGGPTDGYPFSLFIVE